jgi:ADP-glucose pyrophosphorylase
MGQITLGSSVIGASTFNLASGSSVVSNGSNIDGSIINGDLEINDNRNYSNVTVNGNVRINTGANDTVSYSNFKWSGDLTNTSSNTLTINTLDGTAGTTSES